MQHGTVYNVACISCAGLRHEMCGRHRLFSTFARAGCASPPKAKGSRPLTCFRGTRSSATADGPRDALCQSKSCLRCCTIVETSSTTNPQQQIEVMELQHYGRRTCSKQPCRVDRRVFNKLDRRRVLLTTRSTRRGEILKSRVWDEGPKGSALIFEETHSVGTRSFNAKIQLDSYSRFYTI